MRVGTEAANSAVGALEDPGPGQRLDVPVGAVGTGGLAAGADVGVEPFVGERRRRSGLGADGPRTPRVANQRCGHDQHGDQAAGGE